MPTYKPILHVTKRNKGESIDIGFCATDGEGPLDKEEIETILNGELKRHGFTALLTPTENSRMNKGIPGEEPAYSHYSILIPRTHAVAANDAVKLLHDKYVVIQDVGKAKHRKDGGHEGRG